MKLEINDIVLVRVKVFSNDHKVVDKWKQSLYRVVEQLPNHLVFQVQNLEDHTKIQTLHRNMLFPLKSVQNDDQAVEVLVKNVNICTQLNNAN